MTEFGEFSEDLSSVSLSFFVAHRPHESLDLTFTRFTSNGETLPTWETFPLPAQQGQALDLGRFEEGEQIRLGWSFHTGRQVPDEVVLGYFPNGKLTKAVRFARLRPAPFEDYAGEVEITVRAP